MSAHFTTHLDIDLSPEKVWQALTDFAAFPGWNPMVRRASGRLEVGQSLTLHLRALPFPIKARVRGLTQGVELRWGGGVPVLLDVEHYFRIEANGEGVRFVHGEIFDGLLGPLIARLGGVDERMYEGYNRKLAQQAATL